MQTPDFSDHKKWHLLLTVGMNHLQATFLDTETGRRVPYLHRSWQCDPADVLKNIEDAVYEDPTLLDDYNTSIFIRPAMTLLVPPAEYASDEKKIDNALSLVGTTEGKDIWTDPMGEALALFTTPAGVRGFLSRSFLTEDVHHALVPVVDHFTRKAAMEGGEKMWVHLEDKYLDVVAFREGRLLLANTWSFDHPGDAAYYILYAWKTLGFNHAEAELGLSGSKETRDSVIPLLRRFLNYVRLTMYSSDVARSLRENISLPEALKKI